MMNKQIDLKKAIVGIILISLVSSSLVYIYASPPTLTINPYLAEQEYNYIIFKIDSNYYAKNGLNGGIDYQGTNASLVINYVFANTVINDIVYFKTGLYTIYNSINIADNGLTIKAEKGAILKAANGRDFSNGVLTVINHTDITVDGIEINGNKGNSAITGGIYVSGTSFRTIIKNTYIYNCYETAIYLRDPTCTYNKIFNNFVENCGGGIGLEYGSSYNIIQNNHVKATGYHGIISSAGGDYNIIDSNIVENAGSVWGIGFAHGISIDSGADPSSAIRNVISNNIIISPRMCGIEIADYVFGVSIIGNQIYNATEFGIYFGGSLGNGYNSAIVGNVVKYSHRGGIGIRNELSGQYNYGVTVADNIIDNSGLEGANWYGIQIWKTPSATITGNIVFSSRNHGIMLNGSDNNVLANNVIFNNGFGGSQTYGIYFVNSDDGIVSGNRVYDNQGNQTQTWGIVLDSESSNTILIGSSFKGNNIGGILDLSVDTKIDSCYNETSWIIDYP